MIQLDSRVRRRLSHIKAHLHGESDDIDGMLEHIRNNTGDPAACMLGLSSHALASAMHAWFQDHDIAKLRQWSYVAAKTEQQYHLMRPSKLGPAGKFLRLLDPLVSNNSAIVDWYSNYDDVYDLDRVEDHKTRDFWAYQGLIALRGDWGRLLERSARVISDPPKSPKLDNYLVDHHFYLALAQGDVGAMENALESLLKPNVLDARSNDESGFTRDLISTPAVIFCKIARRHGYEVRCSSSLVPSEWLATEPLENYDSHYDFLK